MTFTVRPLTMPAGRSVILRALEGVEENPQSVLEVIAENLEAGAQQGLLLRAGGGAFCGVAIWGTYGLTDAFIQVELVYVDPDAPAGAAAALLDRLWEKLLPNPRLEMIATRLREGDQPMRDALLGHGAAIFTRNLMALPFNTWKPRAVSRPAGYRVVPWQPQHDEQVRALAPQVMAGSVDEIVVAEAQADRVAETLLSIRYGRHPGYSTCVEEATLVALDASGTVVGYVLTAIETFYALIVDLGVQPVHRRRGLGRALASAALQSLDRLECPIVLLGVTAGNTPAVRLYEQLGFSLIGSNESAIWWRDGRQHNWRAG